MQQIGRALEQAVAGRQRRANFRKPEALTPGLDKIGREIIQRLLLAVAGREHDPHAMVAFLPGFRWQIRSPLSSSADRTDLADGLARARQENVEIGKVAVELSARKSTFIILVMKKLKLRIEPIERSTL